MCFALGAGAATRGAAEAPAIAITDVTVIDGTGRPPRQGQSVVIRGGRIVTVSAGEAARIPAGATRLDGRGKFLIPGLWDMHVHLAKTGALSLAEFVANGVTSVRDMGGDFELIARWREEIDEGSRVGPQIKTPGQILEAASNVRRMKAEGTVEPVDRFRIPVADEAEADAAVGRLARLGVDFIKVRTVESPQVFDAVAAAARRRGLSVSGHPVVGVPAMAATSGVRSIEHALLPGLDELSGTLRQRAIARLRNTNVVFVPTTVVRRSVLASMDTAATILADTEGVIEPERAALSGYLLEDWREQIAERRGDPYAGFDRLVPRLLGNLRELHEAGVRLLPGTDSAVLLVYPGASLHDELHALVSDVGLTPMEALVSATRYAAEYFGLEREQGTIAPGKRADLVLLSANPLADIRNTRRIDAVIARGVLARGSDPALAGLPSAQVAPTPPALSREAQVLQEAIAGKESLPAEQVFKNVQLLKGMPADRLLRVMEFGYARALGVRCSYCHAASAWESDDKPEKRIARSMIKMATALNVEHLRSVAELQERNAVVNCGTCHRGRPRPPATSPPRKYSPRLPANRHPQHGSEPGFRSAWR